MVTIVSVGGIGFSLRDESYGGWIKSSQGESLKNLLNRFTGGTISSIATGAVITVLVQSSTATSLMTIGFVSAGIRVLCKPQGSYSGLI